MKKLLLLAVAISVALIGCTNEQEETQKMRIDKRNPIHFNNPAVSSLTRSIGEIQTSYPQDETFNVYALWTQGDYSLWGDGTLYMDNIKVVNQPLLGEVGDKSGWAPEQDYYWPKTGKLTFAAYSPSRAAQHGTITYDGAGLKIDNFVIRPDGYNSTTDAQSTTAQYDLLYSVRTYDCTSSTGGMTYNGVDIHFKHALSSVQFTVKTMEAYAGDILLKNITLKKIGSKGTFMQTITDGAKSDTESPQWSAPSGMVEKYEVFNDPMGKKVTNEVVKLSDASLNGIDMILLPQDFTLNANAELCITFSIPQGGGMLDQTITRKLQDLAFTGSTMGAKWEIGKRYIYHLTFALNKIHFSPEVAAWEDGGNLTIEN